MSSIPQNEYEAAMPVVAAPEYTLFDANAVTLATFFGTPVAGAVLMAVNDRRIGQPGRAATGVILGIVVTGLSILLGYSVPAAASTVLALVMVIAMRRIATAVQGTAVQNHLLRGGRAGSKWVAFGVAVACLAGIFAVTFLVIYLSTAGNRSEPKIVVGSKDEVYYSGAATQAEATALGNALKGAGYFSDAGVTVMLDQGQNGTVLSFVVKDGIWDKPEMVASFDEMAREVAPSIGGFPVAVRLLNKQKAVKGETLVGKYASGLDHVYTLGTATEAQAQALAAALKTSGYFAGKGSDVCLSRQAGSTTLGFVVGDGAWENKGTVASFEDIARQVAPAVGGLPIELHLENTSLEVKKDETIR
jgi:hypothetical protein